MYLRASSNSSIMDSTKISTSTIDYQNLNDKLTSGIREQVIYLISQ